MNTNWKRFMAAALAGFGLAGAAGAAAYTSKSNGNYSVDSTWNEGGNPGVGATSDTVTINAPHTVTVTNKFSASNDVVIVNPGAMLRTPHAAAVQTREFLGGVRVELRGGTLTTDVRAWEGSQSGSRIIVVSNSVIDTYDSYDYWTLDREIFDSLTIYPAVTKVTFTNSWGATTPFQDAVSAFTGNFNLSNSVEFCTETEKTYLELNNVTINAGCTLTKTGPGWLQLKGTTPSGTGKIVVEKGTIQPLVGKSLGTNELVMKEGTTLFVNYIGTSDAFLNLPVRLEGGRINWAYNSWAQASRGFITIASNSTINIYNYHSTINGAYISFDTLAFAQDPYGSGYELHCTQFGGHPNWSNTVIGSKFTYSSTISNNAVINADQYAGLWFDKALVLTAGKTLTKKGEGVVTINGVFTNAGTLAVEGGSVTIVGAVAVNSASSTIANTSMGGATLVAMSGGVRGSGDLVLNNNGPVATGIVVSAAGITNWGRIVNSGTGSGSVLISAPIGTNVTGILQDSATSTLIVSGANSLTSGTVVAAGRLVVSNATGLGAATIRNGAILQGVGAAAGGVTHNHGGALLPGFDGVPGGTLTMGNLTWNGGGVISFDVASIANNESGAGIDYDQLIVTNTLTAVPGGSNLVIRLDSLGQQLAFDTNRNYSLKLIACGKSAVLNPADVTLDTNAFLAGGTWVVTNLNNAIYAVCRGEAPDANKNYWRGTGNWSTATNWSLGHAPLAGEDVEFDLMGAANCAVDLASNNLGSLTLAAGYTGTVMFLTKYPGQGTFTNVTIARNCTIQGGALTHTNNANSETFRLAMTIGGNLTVAAGGAIKMDNKGYFGSGPGYVGSYSGASHGGKGSSLGPTYGSIIAPTNLGSGSRDSPESGGGAVQLVVAGTTTVNGAISSSDAGANSYGSSGGSVFLTTGTLKGNGTIRANGRSSSGGGRIAVILTNSTDFDAVQMQAYGGPGGTLTTIGAAGTIYLQHKNHQPGKGKLIVDNHDYLPSGWTYDSLATKNTLQNGLTASSYEFSEIVLTNAGVYALDTNDTLTITGTTISGDPSDRNEGIYVAGGTLTVPAAFAFSNYYIAIGATNATFNSATSLTVGTNATMKFDVPWTINTPVTLEAGGWLSHSANGSMESYKMNLTVNGNLNIQTGGQVNVDNMGYYYSGPGYVAYYSGASHGGQGTSKGSTYGSITSPTNLGSGSAEAPERGGGAARLLVSGTATVNGVISASDAGGNAYGNSGGSVFLTAGTLAGNGTIRANGRNASGGGRVAVILTNSADFGIIKMQAYGGLSGSPGTVYTETPSQGPRNGLLLVDASNIVSALTTLIGDKVTDTIVGTVIITNKAILAVNTNQTLVVKGSWTNAGSFFARTNSTVEFASANPATIAGSNAFYNLIITNAGKVVSFQAGKTNLIAGLLKLGTTIPDSPVTLQSTADGSWWYVNLTTNAGGTQQIARVTVKDSHAGGGQQLLAGKWSVDGGHNINWKFPKNAGTVIWVR